MPPRRENPYIYARHYFSKINALSISLKMRSKSARLTADGYCGLCCVPAALLASHRQLDGASAVAQASAASTALGRSSRREGAGRAIEGHGRPHRRTLTRLGAIVGRSARMCNTGVLNHVHVSVHLRNAATNVPPPALSRSNHRLPFQPHSGRPLSGRCWDAAQCQAGVAGGAAAAWSAYGWTLPVIERRRRGPRLCRS